MGQQEVKNLISFNAQHIVSTPKKGHFSDHVIIWMCVGPLFERTPAFSHIQSSYYGKKRGVLFHLHSIKLRIHFFFFFFFWFKK